MTLGKKILFAMVGLALVPVVLITTIAVWKADAGFDSALTQTQEAFNGNTELGKTSLLEAGIKDLEHQAHAVYAMCRSQQELLEKKVAADLKVARHILNTRGDVGFADESTTWQAKNQFTGDVSSIDLPQMQVGDITFAQNASAEQFSPVVDPVRDLTSATCTVFQRMNPTGDMLRICTNVMKTDGQRAIGTYIPARNPDGSANEVVSTLLAGQTFTGRAYVVDRWYITAYEPIKNAKGEVIGALYAGVPQESVKSLREAIYSIEVGDTGYVYVLNAKGKTRGHYVISYQGQRDGEDIWAARDADGKPVIQNICQAATALQGDQIGEIRYMWQNPSDPAPREKVVKLAYFEPWDWVIGVGAYSDEFQTAANQMQNASDEAMAAVHNTASGARSAVVTWCIGIGIASVALAIVMSLVLTGTITRPVNRIVASLTEGASQVNDAAGQVASASQQLAEGASQQASSLEETSSALEQMSAMTKNNADNATEANRLAAEARDTANEGDRTTEQLGTAMNAINESADKISKIIKVIEEIAFQTNLLALNAAVEAARAGEHGKGFAVVAEEVRNLAQRAASAAGETTQLIEDSVHRAREGTSVSEQVAQSLSSISQSVSRVSELIDGIAKASTDQAGGINEINDAVTQMDKVTQSNAGSAEEAASAAEELSAQSHALERVVDDLVALTGARRRNQRTNTQNQPASQPASFSTPGTQPTGNAQRTATSAASGQSDNFGDF